MIDFETASTDSSIVLRVRGEVDFDTADQLRTAVMDAVYKASERVEVNLAGVEFLNSSGLSALLAGRNRADEKGIDYIVVDPTPEVAKVIDIVGLTDVLGLR